VAKTIRATCGPKFIELSRRFVPPSSFWRTWQGTLALGLEASSEISTDQATELRRLSSERRKWAHPINGNESLSSAWQTPRSITGGAESGERKQELGRTESGGGDLQAQANQWQTPGTDSFRSRGGDRKDEPGLDQQGRNWPTPTQADQSGHVGEYPKTATHNEGKTLATASDQWPTPTANDDNKTPEAHLAMKKRMGERDGTNANRTAITSLQVKVQTFPSFPLDPPTVTDGDESLNDTPNSRRQWPTPRASDGPPESSHARTWSTTDRNLHTVIREIAPTKRLNPRFVAWLMNWPDPVVIFSDSTETASSRYKQRMRSAFWRLVSDITTAFKAEM